MATIIDGRRASFTAGGTIPKFSLVKLDADGDITVCGTTDTPIGSCDDAAVDQDKVSVSLLNTSGSIKVIAAEAAAVGSDMYTAASGECADTSGVGYTLIGVLKEAAAAQGDVVEVIVTQGYLATA